MYSNFVYKYENTNFSLSYQAAILKIMLSDKDAEVHISNHDQVILSIVNVDILNNKN